MNTATFNLVSSCCFTDIETRRGTDYPLGGRSFGISYKYEACLKCGEECDKVEVCGSCGEFECRGCE